jgi:hypothetical protein
MGTMPVGYRVPVRRRDPESGLSEQPDPERFLAAIGNTDAMSLGLGEGRSWSRK